MRALRHVLGVDAGATKTIALVARVDGAIAGAGRGGCGDIYSAGPELALAAVEGAIAAALEAAHIARHDIAAGAFNMAGADWPEDFALLRDALRRDGFGRVQVIVNDAMAALRAGSPDNTGVAVVCGTAVAIGARAPDGRAWHTSHWQEPQGSLHLARKALTAVYRAELGIDGPTSLTARVLELFEQRDVEDVLHLLTARVGARPAGAGRAARLLLDEAEAGDATAREIVHSHGAALGDYALAAARRVGIEETPFTLALAGGVLRHPGRLLPDAIVARVQRFSPHARPTTSPFEPAVGALFLALEAAGVAVDAPLLQRLVPTLPPSTLYLS